MHAHLLVSGLRATQEHYGDPFIAAFIKNVLPCSASPLLRMGSHLQLHIPRRRYTKWWELVGSPGHTAENFLLNKYRAIYLTPKDLFCPIFPASCYPQRPSCNVWYVTCKNHVCESLQWKDTVYQKVVYFLLGVRVILALDLSYRRIQIWCHFAALVMPGYSRQNFDLTHHCSLHFTSKYWNSRFGRSMMLSYRTVFDIWFLWHASLK